MEFVLAILKGVGMGLGAAVPIGPVNLEMARRTLRDGTSVGLAVGIGMIVGDVLLALLGGALGARLARDQTIQRWLTFPAVVVLAAIGLWALRGAVQTMRGGIRESSGDLLATVHERPSGALHMRAMSAGLLMTLVNPAVWIYWFTAMPAVLGHVGLSPAFLAVPVLLLGVFAGGAAWVLLFNGLIGYVGQFRQKWWLLAADLGGAVVLLVLAGVLLWKGIAAHL